MKRRLVCALSAAAVLAIAASPASSGAGSRPSGRILLTGEKIELFSPATGRSRTVATRGVEPAFLPSGTGFVYIREGGGCAPAGHGSCFTRYSVFEKSFRRRSPKARGRRIFGWNAFFVREVDVSPDGRLVFSASPGPGPKGTLSIYTSSRSGRHVRRLTRGHFDNDPVVSPDDRRIAFARRVHGRAQIFSIRLGGGGLTRLTHDRGRDRLPDWSPNGRRLAFISQPAGSNAFGRREIYTVGARGGHERRLTHNRKIEDDPVFSPDGRHIAFLRGGDLWTMGAGGARAHEVLRGRGYVGFEGGVDWG
jgi:dipeptidyl aminopeptidase/acylaminoacyl peptidase